MKTLVITSGGFDPLHAGHVNSFQKMAEIGDLCVIVNSDQWLYKKKQKCLMTRDHRSFIIESLSCVTFTWEQLICEETKDDVIWEIKGIVEIHKNQYDRFVFAKSGDRTSENSPEYEWCMANGVEWLEVESDYPDLHSSKILEDWQSTPVERKWGQYLTTIPYQIGNLKFKPKILLSFLKRYLQPSRCLQ